MMSTKYINGICADENKWPDFKEPWMWSIDIRGENMEPKTGFNKVSFCVSAFNI